MVLVVLSPEMVFVPLETEVLSAVTRFAFWSHVMTTLWMYSPLFAVTVIPASACMPFASAEDEVIVKWVPFTDALVVAIVSEASCAHAPVSAASSSTSIESSRFLIIIELYLMY